MSADNATIPVAATPPGPLMVTNTAAPSKTTEPPGALMGGEIIDYRDSGLGGLGSGAAIPCHSTNGTALPAAPGAAPPRSTKE